MCTPLALPVGRDIKQFDFHIEYTKKISPKMSGYLMVWLLLAALPVLMCFRAKTIGGRSSLHRSFSVSASTQCAENKIFIFGLGYVGTAFAEYLQSLGWSVAGTCTNVNKALEFRKRGIQTYLFDEMTVRRGQSEATADILNSNYILSTIPPVAEGQQDLVLEAHLDDFRKARLSNQLKWIGYLSSTGVYGDCNGAWVTEDRIPAPENSKTIARYESEQQWSVLQQKSGLPVHTFRLAGIYGPGRSALDTLLDQYSNQNGATQSIRADDVTFISRVHVDDIVKVLHASMSLPKPGSVFNVADDMPSTRYDVMSYCAKLLQLPGEFVVPSVSNDGTRGGSKRVDNGKMRQLLADAGCELSYPDYRRY